MKNTPRIAFYALGCKVNQNEVEALSALFRERGYTIVDYEEPADFYVINTCTVTHLADRKSRQMIRRALKANPEAQIVVTGCYAQTDAEAVRRVPGVSLIVGTNEKGRLPELVEELQEREQATAVSDTVSESPRIVVRKYEELRKFDEIKTEKNIARARAYLKVQEGCDQFCAYCIIPYARGPVRSRSLENTLTEAKKLIKAGFHEIILTGIHLGAYGRDLGAGKNIEYLLEQLLPLDEKVRWRLSSLEPTEVTPVLIQLLQEYPNFCPHLHLPLQSGHDEILKAMKRPYTTAQYLQTVTKLREVIPDLALTTDVMVGFPGETEKHFQEYLRFTEEAAFSRLHVFKYSPRKGTPAAQFPEQVSPAQKEVRSRALIQLGKKLERLYAEKFLNQRLPVLAEEKINENTWEGSSDNYLKIRFHSAEELRGQIVPVLLKKIEEHYCHGELFQLQ